MSGSRPLIPAEERRLVRHIRRINSRDRALISAQLFLGFRVSEVLALTVGHVFAGGHVRARVALPPRFLKGGYGGTRTIPVGPELRRALKRNLEERARHEDLQPGAPLFLSPRRELGGASKQICRSMAEKIIKRALIAVCGDPQGLSTHSLRKSWASRLYKSSGHDLLVVRDGLGHRSVAVTQVYLPTNRARLEDLVLQSDWTRSRKHAGRNADSVRAISSVKPKRRAPDAAPCLPGLEDFAA
ncbi:MAG: tyrosine-type recombinase/integrase [Opitutaceae bacterium]|nr:tyrosine-type recombinase/integrase [Opitutaceae bacterium]